LKGAIRLGEGITLGIKSKGDKAQRGGSIKALGGGIKVGPMRFCNVKGDKDRQGEAGHHGLSTEQLSDRGKKKQQTVWESKVPGL